MFSVQLVGRVPTSQYPEISQSAGTVCWTVQVMPQIYKSYRTKSTKGLSEWLLYVVCLSSVKPLNTHFQLAVGFIWAVPGRICGRPGSQHPFNHSAPAFCNFGCSIMGTGVIWFPLVLQNPLITPPVSALRDWTPTQHLHHPIIKYTGVDGWL